MLRPTQRKGKIMIPANGWIAWFDFSYTAAGKARHRSERRSVAYFTENGAGMVVGDDGTLVDAESVKGFEMYDNSPPVAAVIPAAPGWTVRFIGDTGDEDPVEAWAVYADGTSKPMTAWDDGLRIPQTDDGDLVPYKIVKAK
jgi:hypothetical protein